MKKNNSNNENVNVVENMSQFINDNISLVPNVMMKRFMNLTIEQQAAKIQHYMYVQEMRAQRRLVNRVRDLFDRRHATVEDANEVLAFCNEFISSAKEREIAAIDEEIAKLMQKKQSINI